MQAKFFAVMEAVLLFVIVLFGVTALLTIMSLERSVIWSAEAAGWVQALGSIGAIVGAFMVVNYQTTIQRRRDDALAKLNATIAASHVYFQVMHHRIELELIHAWTRQRLSVETSGIRYDFNAQIKFLSSLSFDIAPNLIRDLLPLENDCAYRLASACSQFESAKRAAQRALSALDVYEEDAAMDLIRMLDRVLAICITSLRICEAACQKVAGEYAIHSSREEDSAHDEVGDLAIPR